MKRKATTVSAFAALAVAVSTVAGGSASATPTGFVFKSSNGGFQITIAGYTDGHVRYKAWNTLDRGLNCGIWVVDQSNKAQNESGTFELLKGTESAGVFTRTGYGTRDTSFRCRSDASSSFPTPFGDPGAPKYDYRFTKTILVPKPQQPAPPPPAPPAPPKKVKPVPMNLKPNTTPPPEQRSPLDQILHDMGSSN